MLGSLGSGSIPGSKSALKAGLSLSCGASGDVMTRNSCLSGQGERGPPGVNGTQGFQGCPGQRGIKVQCGGPVCVGTTASAKLGRRGSAAHAEVDSFSKCLGEDGAWASLLSASSHWGLSWEGSLQSGGFGVKAALGREPGNAEIVSYGNRQLPGNYHEDRQDVGQGGEKASARGFSLGPREEPGRWGSKRKGEIIHRSFA